MISLRKPGGALIDPIGQCKVSRYEGLAGRGVATFCPPQRLSRDIYRPRETWVAGTLRGGFPIFLCASLDLTADYHGC